MTRPFRCLLILCVAVTLPLHAQQPASRVHKLEELRYPQIAALDRQRTMVILPIGMLEEHGPHLPIGADTLGVTHEADAMARRLSRQLPQWQVVMMPPIHYGESGANEIAGLYVHPGTYGIRHSTVRALVADVGAQVAQNGFTWIFVLTGHGAPTHGVAVNDACDFVSENFGVSMVHVSGVFRASAALQDRGKAIAAKHFSAADLASFGMDVHAGVAETAAMLALRRDLVDPGYTKLPARAGSTREELYAVANTPGWQGYLSVPAKATAAYGRDIETWWIDGQTDLIVRAVNGENLLTMPRAPQMDPAMQGVFAKSLEHERAFEAKLEAWLARRQQRPR
jgi:creatinine amidohydrolase